MTSASRRDLISHVADDRPPVAVRPRQQRRRWCDPDAGADAVREQSLAHQRRDDRFGCRKELVCTMGMAGVTSVSDIGITVVSAHRLLLKTYSNSPQIATTYWMTA
jgi:hypothetical protein